MRLLVTLFNLETEEIAQKTKMFKKLIVGIVFIFASTGGYAGNGHSYDEEYVGYKRHYAYGGVDYYARSTATRRIGIAVDRGHTRGNGGASIKLTFNPRKCTQQAPWPGDCSYGAKRTQLQTHRLWPTNKALTFHFSVWKNNIKSKTMTWYPASKSCGTRTHPL